MGRAARRRRRPARRRCRGEDRPRSYSSASPGRAGMKATFYQGRPEGRTFDGPVVVGLRPGYMYRVQLSDFADRPGLAIYPTLEVRGTLFLPAARQSRPTIPAPVVLTDADLRSALAGSLVTKVIYLEDPDKAVPTAHAARRAGRSRRTAEPRPDRRVPRPRPADAGGALRRPRAAAGRAAGTDPSPARSLCRATRFCRRRALGRACRGPAAGFYDPIIGPRPPTEECLHDGGDRGPRRDRPRRPVARSGPRGHGRRIHRSGRSAPRGLFQRGLPLLAALRRAAERAAAGPLRSRRGHARHAFDGRPDAGGAGHAQPATATIRRDEVDLSAGRSRAESWRRRSSAAWCAWTCWRRTSSIWGRWRFSARRLRSS